MRAAFCVAVVALAASVLQAFAQQDAELLPGEETGETVEPVRRYTVELIIFSYGESASAGTETWIDATYCAKRLDMHRACVFRRIQSEFTGHGISRNHQGRGG